MSRKKKCNLCGSSNNILISKLYSKPELETIYPPFDTNYYREIRFCNNCNVYFNFYKYGFFDDSFYKGIYNSYIEGGQLKKRFEKIINLSYLKSDNKIRVDRIKKFIDFNLNIKSPQILDVGSGTGVFPYEMSKYFNNIFVVDPDAESIKLIKEVVKIDKAWCGTIDDLPVFEKFNFITFNKVLEHIKNPILLLNKAINKLYDNGIIYIELPFAEKIIQKNIQNNRAEFFIEHFNVYTTKSFLYLLKMSGLKSLKMNNFIEPSGKHTICSFNKII